MVEWFNLCSVGCELLLVLDFSHVFPSLCAPIPVQPAPLSETVDHTLEDDGLPPPHKAFQCPSPPRSPFPSPSLEEESGDSCEGESEGEEEEVLSFEGELCSVCPMPWTRTAN